jgi:hypothetical protein
MARDTWCVHEGYPLCGPLFFSNHPNGLKFPVPRISRWCRRCRHDRPGATRELVVFSAAVVVGLFESILPGRLASKSQRGRVGRCRCSSKQPSQLWGHSYNYRILGVVVCRRHHGSETPSHHSTRTHSKRPILT